MFFPAWRQWLENLARVVGRPLRKAPRRRPGDGAKAPALTLWAEKLEDRISPSLGSAQPAYIRAPLTYNAQPQSGPLLFNGGFTPSGIQKAYGIDKLIANGNAGAGQTIALIGAFDNPAFSNSGTAGFASSDLHFFDKQFGLPDPVFRKVAQDGTTNYPGTDSSIPPNDWEGEEALDVEWAHAVAPAAHILLVECNSDTNDDLSTGAKWAATPVARGGGGATVVSMSFGTNGGLSGETAFDADFSPVTFPGVTFLAAAGDNGSVNRQGDYPADSPNVIAVGGTHLVVNGSGDYSSETVWNGTGGGISRFETQPVYQKAAEPSQTRRTTPDVAFVADPNTGVAVYDSYNQGAGPGDPSNIIRVGGTSLSTPCWAGLVAIANQIRAGQTIPEPPLTGATQTLPILYKLYGSPSYHQLFHDITSGGNGTFNASAGYDLVSGIGSPIANTLVPALANVGQLVYAAPSGTNSLLLQVSGGNLNLYDNGTLVASSPFSQTSSAIITGARDNSLTVNAAGLVANLAVTFDGGPGSLAHTLTLKNGSFTNETYTYTAAGSGTISADGLTISFSHVTTSANTTAGSNIIFDLPAAAQATLAASSSPNNSLIGSGLVTSSFGNSMAALTVNTAGGGSLVHLAAMDPNFKPGMETFSGQAGDIFQFQDGTALAGTTSVTVTTATLDLHGFSPVVDALDGNGTITDSALAASTLTIGAGNGSGTFAGILQDGASTLALTKTGTGTETLAGSNTYTGPSTVAGGILEVDGSIASSSTTALSSAVLAGAGTAGTVAVQNGGALFTSTRVSALVSGSLNLSSGSTVNIAINSPGSYSQEKVTSGTISLAGANLVFSGNLMPAQGQFFTIMNNEGSSPVSGTFNGLPEGTVIPNFLGSSLGATITYIGGDGNDVLLYVGQGALTTTALTTSTGNSVYGQPVTFTATVSATSAAPTGNVEFFDKTTGADLGAGTLVSSGAVSSTWVYTTTPTQIEATGGQADDIRAVFTPAGSFFVSGGILAGGLTVAPSPLSVSGLTANNKVYDQSAAAVINTANAALVGVFAGDTVILNASSVSAAFASRDVGTGIAVSVSGLTLGGARARDYTLTQPASTADIAPAPLTVTGITASNKMYDGQTSATLNTTKTALAGVIGGDVVTLSASGATGAFVSKDAGNNIAVAVSGVKIGGAQVGDYVLTPPVTAANIAPAPLTVAGVTADKVYDATLNATLTLAGAVLAGVLASDVVTLNTSAAAATFATRNVGSNIPVTVSGLTAGGPQGADYILMQPALTANITPAPLTASGINANNKVYDATTTATLNTTKAALAGVFSGDSVTLLTTGATGTFAGKDVGADIPVILSGLTIGGAQAGNYRLETPALSASITPLTLTVSGVTANDKVYDASPVALLNTGNAALHGVLSGDTVILNTSGAIGTLASKDVGAGIVVSVSGLTLGGTQAGDYALTQPAATANVSPAPLTVTGLKANDKVYNATPTATLNTDNAVLGGLFPGDSVTLIGATGTFASQDAGSNIPVTSLQLGGAQAGDYAPVFDQPPPTATITPAPLTLTGIAANKVYDGTTTATLNPANAALIGLFNGDTVTLAAAGATGTFDSKDVGNNIAVTLSGLTLGGAQADDYELAQPAQTTANITPAPLTVTGITANKVYDGTIAATPNTSQAALVGLFSGDAVALKASAATGHFISKEVGNNILAVLSGLTLGGAQAADYALKQPIITKANITPAPLTVKGIMADKVYDATTLAPLNTATAVLVGIFGGDVVTLNTSGAMGSFASKDVANNVAVTVQGLTLGDTRARDYTLTQPVFTANITPAPLTVTGITANDKVYDATTRATLNTANAALAGILSGDMVTLNSSGATGTFASRDVGSGITVTVSGLALGGPQAGDYFLTQPTTAANITPMPPKVTSFAISAPAGALVGRSISFTVTARDEYNDVMSSGYTGTVHFSSTDGLATLPGDITLTSGMGTFSATFNTPGIQTISASDALSIGIAGTSNLIAVNLPATHFAVSAPATAMAGDAFLVTVTAQDGSGHTATAYSGTVHVTSMDGQAILLPANAALTNGVGSFAVTLKTVAGGPWTVTFRDTMDQAIAGTSSAIAVSPGVASYFTVNAPGGSVTTGIPIPVTVTAYDRFGNIASAYAGHVHFNSNDGQANLPADSLLVGGVGSFNVTLNTAGSQTITVADTAATSPGITGTSSAITTRGLTVTAFTPTATGFSATFSKPFLPGNITLYGEGLQTVVDVVLVGAVHGPISGSLFIDPSDTSITFNATANSLLLINNFVAPILPDDTYTATIVSGSGPNGFVDASGAGLDGLGNGTSANYVSAPFTTHYQANTTPILGIPDFARGPDGGQAIKVPSDTGHGIPITLYNAAGVTDVTFTLSYNPALLAIVGGSNGDGIDPAASFIMIGSPTIVDTTHARAVFHFQDGTPQSGTVVLGDIMATVPSSAAGDYKAKELLQLGAITVNGASFNGASTSSLHVNAYFGDVSGNGTIDGLDVATAYNVAQGKDTGFAAYPLLDPAIVGDVALDYSVDAGDVSTLAAFVSHLSPPQVPALPIGLTITAVGPDPVLNLAQLTMKHKGRSTKQTANSLDPSYFTLRPSLTVTLDDPRPPGSTGMTEAILALRYDPSVLSVSASDLTLGSIPSQGLGWQLSAVIDQTSGQIGVILYSTTPVTSTQTGSLVNIAFHIKRGERRGLSPPVLPTTTVSLVASMSLNGQQFSTQVDDAQGQLVLGPGVDRLVILGAHAFENPARGRRNQPVAVR